MQQSNPPQWQIWIDRGGTFTDIVAIGPQGHLHTHKLLSDNPSQYHDATIAGIRHLLKLPQGAPIPAEQIDAIKMGTTVATNALLEHQGEPTVLVITKGFGDALRIAYQNRPDLFALEIKLPEQLYSKIIEVEERINVHGEVLVPLAVDSIKRDLQKVYDAGMRSVAIVLMHSYLSSQHELAVAEYAKAIGFTQVSVSHQVNPIIKLVGRGDTTVIDAYLSPKLARYVDSIAEQVGKTQLYFMQSNGGLAEAHAFHGKDSVLSGPAAGVIGAIKVSEQAGFNKIITFDMGGTSTDVAHYSGKLERRYESIIAGVRLRAPMMHIHTIAAGGGSLVHYQQGRYQVGPDSAGANPGPVCYRRGGPLTLTDCNVMLGRVQPDFFPKAFGPNADQALDYDAVHQQFTELAKTIADDRDSYQIAQGFVRIAVHNMANAIKTISVQRGHDVAEYALCCFGGAGGQFVCSLADTLGIKTILVHPLAGVLSAYGLGQAEIRVVQEQAVLQPFTQTLHTQLNEEFTHLESQAREKLIAQGVSQKCIRCVRRVRLHYLGSDTTLEILFADLKAMQTQFTQHFLQEFGYSMVDKQIGAASIVVEGVGNHHYADIKFASRGEISTTKPAAMVKAYFNNALCDTPLYIRDTLSLNAKIMGPAIIVDPNSTTIIDPGWQAAYTPEHLILQRAAPLEAKESLSTEADPMQLEVFNNLFMSIAEQMGTALAKTAYSVNIKERLDFSCAIFDDRGQLVANAPHMPVHLGSMYESVQTIIKEREGYMHRGDAYMLNNPYNGGTHLPDVTIITPVFYGDSKKPLFFVGSRAHQADIGGITPGSVPANSVRIEQEGVLIDNFTLVEKGEFKEQELKALLTEAEYPVRNLEQSLADLQAQLAANHKGVNELIAMIDHYSQDVVSAYMQHIQDNAEYCVRELIGRLQDGKFTYAMDNGSHIHVAIKIDHDKREAVIDFTGTSKQQPNNFNAPRAVCYAAVLYVFRCLVNESIPLNQGCLVPLNIIIPDDCLLNPQYPAAVVAGNVETSQCVVDTLFGALKVMAASQGTMNNFTFGNARYQYYETICGGSGAGPDFDGTSAVHTHMTNSLLTDPEILEQRFPVLVEQFKICKGSGGAGKHRGGDGVIRKIRFLEAMTAAIVSNRRLVAPYGMKGAEDGMLGENLIQRSDGAIEKLVSTCQVEMQPGDVFIIQTPGGGGYEKQ